MCWIIGGCWHGKPSMQKGWRSRGFLTGRTEMLRVPRPCGLWPRAKVGAWRSLVARCVRDAKVEGSNPFAPTSSYFMSIAHLREPAR